MLRPRSVRGVAVAGLACALLAGFGGAHAHAQSYNEVMSERSAEAFYEDVQRRISSATHDGPTYYLSRDYTLTPEQEKYLEERRQNDEELNRLRNDPVLMRHVNGYWEHYQTRESAKPGEFCAATYANLHGTITLSGVDKSWEGGLLTFIGENVPRPDTFRQITATLTQTGEPPATVKIYNAEASPKMHGFGTLIFAVPSMNAALSGMTDKADFAVAIEGKEVFRMSWKDGLKARDALRRCVRQR